MTQTLKPRIRAGKRLPLSAPPILHRSVAQDQSLVPLPARKSDAVTVARHLRHQDQEVAHQDQGAAQGLIQEAPVLGLDPDRDQNLTHAHDRGLPGEQAKMVQGKGAKDHVPGQDHALTEG